MSNNESNEIELIPTDNTPSELETSISSFNKPLANLLTHIGLPTENVLSPIEERRKVIYSLESTLEILPLDERERAYYLSKFTVAITIGLFDGALTFLWDETIKAMRKYIVSFDLQYFYKIAGTLSGKYKNLDTEEDLEVVSDHDLLEICRRIGLLNKVEHKRLEHVNYLRNHASSAHPNENEITGFEMLSLLENCLKYAITAEPDHSIIKLKQLLTNIRTTSIPKEDFEVIGQDIANQPQERIDDFIKSIFGMYCDPQLDETVKENIENLISYVWDCCIEDTKYIIGSKYGKYRKNGDVERKEATQRILELVDGERYKDEDSLAAELIEKLQDLRTTHFEFHNFYNEYSHAKSIKKSLPQTGVPEAARKLFVKVICLCFIGNGKGYRKGVDERALPYYKEFIESFTVKEVVEFLYLLQDPEFVGDFDKDKADKRVRKLAKYLKNKSKNVHINKILDLIIDFPSRKIGKIADVKGYKQAIKHI